MRTPTNTPLSDYTDNQLVTLSQSGDQGAFSELVRRHENACHKLAYSVLRDRSDAEDEVQNALWKAYEHIGQFQQDSKFSTWLTRIVLNQCLMKLRKAKRARFLYVDDVAVGEDTATLDLPDECISPEQELARKEVASVLDTEMHRIPALLRQVFLMRDVDQRPMQDVADELGISVAAAKSRLLRARAELRTRLEKHQGRLGVATLTALG